VLDIAPNDIVSLDPQSLAKRIDENGRQVRFTIEIPNLYAATSKTALAENWLKAWYTGERLASHAVSPKCKASDDGTVGTGTLVFDLIAADSLAMAEDLIEFAAVHSGDDLEAAAFAYDEADDWLANRGDAVTRFSELEKNYRADAATAAAAEGYRPGSHHAEDEVELD
jgi:hypothetical protein